MPKNTGSGPDKTQVSPLGGGSGTVRISTFACTSIIPVMSDFRAVQHPQHSVLPVGYTRYASSRSRRRPSLSVQLWRAGYFVDLRGGGERETLGLVIGCTGLMLPLYSQYFLSDFERFCFSHCRPRPRTTQCQSLLSYCLYRSQP